MATTLVDNLSASSIGWKAYMEDAPSACYKGGGINHYAKNHNPFMYFSSILNDSTKCNLVVPFASNFVNDLSNNAAPPFMWVTPNNCDNMHDSTCSLTSGGCTSGKITFSATHRSFRASVWRGRIRPSFVRRSLPFVPMSFLFGTWEPCRSACSQPWQRSASP